MDTLKELLAILGFGPENIQAVLYISLGSVFGTQVLKRQPWMPAITPELLSAVLGGALGAFLLPTYLEGALVGAVIGMVWAIMYKPVMRLVYKRWPELEEKVSAKPQKVVQTPQGVEVRDADVPSDADEHTILHVDAPTVPKGIKPEPSNE